MVRLIQRNKPSVEAFSADTMVNGQALDERNNGPEGKPFTL